MSTSLRDWILTFEKNNKRKLKVLHVGNIANNAYLNSKILRQAGVESDVLSYDYYHIMGCPEWEECNVDMSKLDQFKPNWYELDQKGYIRPQWFVQGRLRTCLNFLLNKNRKNSLKAKLYWFFLSYQNRTNKFFLLIKLLVPIRWIQLIIKRFVHKYLLEMIREVNHDSFLKQNIFSRLVYRATIAGGILHARQIVTDETRAALVQKAETKYLDSKLSTLELVEYEAFRSLWNEVMAEYDVIQFYATSGIYGFISDRKYLAFEHGTIRTIPFQDNHQGRVTEAAFKGAHGVFITNCDNIVAAKKLKLKNYYFVPHCINEDSSSLENKDSRYLHVKYNADFLIIHPSRQDWSDKRDVNTEKGNDIFINGIAKFLKENPINLKCILIEWGVSAQKTKDLIKSLNLENRFFWIKPLTYSALMEHMNLCDAIFDQATIGTFGAIPPQCLSLGKPVFVHLEEEFHKWCFTEMPPVFGCKTPDMVSVELKRLTRAGFDQKSFISQSKDWYLKNYSKEHILNVHIRAYQDLLKTENARLAIIE